MNLFTVKKGRPAPKFNRKARILRGIIPWALNQNLAKMHTLDCLPPPSSARKHHPVIEGTLTLFAPRIPGGSPGNLWCGVLIMGYKFPLFQWVKRWNYVFYFLPQKLTCQNYQSNWCVFWFTKYLPFQRFQNSQGQSTNDRNSPSHPYQNPNKG